MMARYGDHPDRAASLAEIHARPITILEAPARVRRIAFLIGPDGDRLQAARQSLDAFCTAARVGTPDPSARRVSFATARRRVTWEFHTEFYTVTWTAPPRDAENWPSDIGLGAVGQDCVAVAVRVDVLATDVIHASAIASFDALSLCFSTIESGRAQVATDFLTDDQGFTHYEIAAGATDPPVVGALVRRILEIETYRVLALVGVPLARVVSPQLNALESSLESAMATLGSEAQLGGNQALLERLHDLQVEATHMVERTRYRFGAGHAYGDILRQRLRNLDERACGSHRTLQRYLHHRLDPALATFRAIEARQEALFERMARATAMLGTRISLDIQVQTRTILQTISETANSQYRLQSTVEGLSTIAITYYLLGIIGHALEALAPRFEHEKSLATGALAPVILVVVWILIRRGRRH